MTDSAEAGLSLARFFGSSLSNAVLFILMSLLGHQTSGHWAWRMQETDGTQTKE
jgi:hypothetical protein